MRKILVTAVSGDIGNGILKILRDTENELYGCDINEYAAGMDKVTEFWQEKPAGDEGYIESLVKHCRKLEITHMIPVNEKEIDIISKNLEKFKDIGIKVIILNNEILDICLDKYKTAKYLEKENIIVPKTFLVDEWTEDGNNYICKPRKSNGSKDIKIIKTYEELESLEGDKEDYVIQEYIDSEEEYTVGIFSDGKEITSIAFKRKLKHGYSDYVEYAKNEELEKLAYSIARLFDLYGYINFQLRKKDNKYYIFEINPRISGTVRFRDMLGFRDVVWWLNIADGLPSTQKDVNIRKAIGLRELEEKYIVIE